MRFSAAFLALCAVLHAPLHAAWTFSVAETRPAPPGLEFVERKAAEDMASAHLFIVSFSTKAHTFVVMDNPDGAFDTAGAAQKRGALAAVNGGYFHPDRTPLGLVVRQGVEIHPLEKA